MEHRMVALVVRVEIPEREVGSWSADAVASWSESLGMRVAQLLEQESGLEDRVHSWAVGVETR